VFVTVRGVQHVIQRLSMSTLFRGVLGSGFPITQFSVDRCSASV
jgi:hypothetical protein